MFACACDQCRQQGVGSIGVWHAGLCSLLCHPWRSQFSLFNSPRCLWPCTNTIAAVAAAANAALCALQRLPTAPLHVTWPSALQLPFRCSPQVDKVSATTVTIKAPPADMPYVAPAGWYVLYLLGQEGTYSEGVWVQITAPPATALSGSGSGSSGGSGGNSGGAGKGKGTGPKKAGNGRTADKPARKAK